MKPYKIRIMEDEYTDDQKETIRERANLKISPNPEYSYVILVDLPDGTQLYVGINSEHAVNPYIVVSKI